MQWSPAFYIFILLSYIKHFGILETENDIGYCSDDHADAEDDGCGRAGINIADADDCHGDCHNSPYALDSPCGRFDLKSLHDIHDRYYG